MKGPFLSYFIILILIELLMAMFHFNYTNGSSILSTKEIIVAVILVAVLLGEFYPKKQRKKDEKERKDHRDY